VEIDLSLHPQQSVAFKSEANEILYGGAAGGGKSHLMRVIAIMMCSEIAGLQVYLFRRISDDLFKNHMEGAAGFYAMLAPWFDAKLVKFNGSKNYLEFWNGSKIWLSHCQHEKDVIKYQGPEIHVLLIDELTHFSEKIYRFLRNRVRLGGLQYPEKYQGKLPLILCGSNPGGMGHSWVKRSFVDSAAPLAIHRTVKKEGGMLRQYIPAKLDDNPTLVKNDPDYIDRLEGLGNAALVKAMKDGDWNIVFGGAFDDVWSQNAVKPRFKVPKSWTIDRAFDWGSSHPFSVGWFAKADGTEATLEDGSTFCPPKGSLIQIFEWYGTKELGTNEGLKMSSEAIAKEIATVDRRLLSQNWIETKVQPGPADNQIRNVIDKSVPTIEKLMRDNGVTWSKSDKSPGSRVIGLELMRTRLSEVLKDYPEKPGLYFMNNCLASISILPTLPRDEKKTEDVDTNAEDHVYDMVRYRVLATAKAAKTTSIKTGI
jgi:hypothetical protein